MFGLNAEVRVYFAKEAADMPKSFDGLVALASDRLALDPLLEHLFVFIKNVAIRSKCFIGTVMGWWSEQRRKSESAPADLGVRTIFDHLD